MPKFAEGKLALLLHEFSNKAHCPTITRAPVSSSSVSLSSTGVTSAASDVVSRPGLSEQFLRHRLLQSLPDPSRSNHGELPKTLFGDSELAALLQNPAQFPDEMPVEQSVARPA